jgi:DNA polymerase/3'-5' exonuclease PolX
MQARQAERLTELPGIGPALAARLVARGITTRARLLGAEDELPLETRIFLRYEVCRAIPAAAGAAALAELCRRLVFAKSDGRPCRCALIVVGSARRGEGVLKDLDFLVVAPDARALPGLLAGARLRPPRPGDRASVVAEFSSGERRRTVIVAWAGPRGGAAHYAVDFFAATAQERPYALYHWTGSYMYNVRTRMAAKRKGWRLNQYGLWYGDTNRRVRGTAGIRTERELANFLGVSYRPPAARGL